MGIKTAKTILKVGIKTFDSEFFKDFLKTILKELEEENDG